MVKIFCGIQFIKKVIYCGYGWIKIKILKYVSKKPTFKNVKTKIPLIKT